VTEINGGFTFGPTIAAPHTAVQAVAIEGFITFLLVSVVLNVATTKATSDNSFYGLSIGCVVIAGAYSVGNITGGAFNPAVGTGPHIIQWLLGRGFYSYIWVYWLGPLLGAASAAGFFRITNPKEYDVHLQSAGIMPEVLDHDPSAAQQHYERLEAANANL